MDIGKIRELIETLTGLMDARRLDELEIEVEGLKVALRRGRNGERGPLAAFAPALAAPTAAASEPHAPATSEAPSAPEGAHIVTSPMVGIFYRAASPDSNPFVEVGDEVKPDSVLCIIEAMKVMNELKAEVEGVVQAIRVESGETVEYGQALFVIAPAKP